MTHRFVWLGLCVACSAPPEAATSPEAESSDVSSSPTGPTGEAPTGEAPPGDATDPSTRDTLTVAGARAHLAEAPPNADPDRAIVLDEPLEDLPIGFQLLAAHRIGDGLLVLQTNHELWWRDANGARRIERDVEAPLSVRGRRVAFARGDMPDFEIVMLELAGSGRSVDFIRPLTAGFAPTWNPALGPAGDVVFVSGRSGEAELYRVRPGETPVKLVLEGSFPSSIEAPRYDGVSLRFHDEHGAEHTLRIRYASEVPPTIAPPSVEQGTNDTTGPSAGGTR